MVGTGSNRPPQAKARKTGPLVNCPLLGIACGFAGLEHGQRKSWPGAKAKAIRRSRESGRRLRRQLCRGILRVAVNRVMRAELARQRLLVLAARDRDGLEAHLHSELNAQMAEAADAEHGDDVARTRAAVPKRVVGGDAGAEERGRLQETAVAAVVGDSGNLRRDAAGDEVPSLARIAVSAVPVVPADPDTIFDRPAGHFAAERVARFRELSGPALPTRSRATKCAIALTATAETVNPSTSNASKSKPPKR